MNVQRLGYSALVAVLLTGIGVATFFVTRKAEPSFENKSLTEWLEELQTDNPKALAAVQSIGTNAIPTLLKMLRSKQSRLLRTAPDWTADLNWTADLIQQDARFKVRKQELAVRGFEALGERGAIAVPR